MAFDIVEIALDRITDATDFEKVASEIMREEGYPDIKPMGGVHDSGIDASQDMFFVSGDVGSTIFQYTLQEGFPGKIQETIATLKKNNIKFDQLVIVTPRTISSQTQLDIKRDVRQKFAVTVDFFERKTLVNRLSDYSTGIFNRHFPNIEAQISDLAKSAVRVPEGARMEQALLQVAVGLAFAPTSSHLRGNLIDKLVLFLVLQEDSPSDYRSVSARWALRFPTKPLTKDQYNKSIERLSEAELIAGPPDAVEPAAKAFEVVEIGRLSEAEAIGSVVADILHALSLMADRSITQDHLKKADRNTREALVGLFRLRGAELARSIIGGKTTDVSDDLETLISTIQRDLPAPIGTLLVAQIATAFNSPTEEQAHGLASLARSFLALSILNFDPALQQIEADRLKKKVFVCDTDFVLSSLVVEDPESAKWRTLISQLIGVGCRVIIPASCLEECILHAQISPRTFLYFGPRLHGLNPEQVKERVNNAFVKGFYWAVREGQISIKTTYTEYLENYWDKNAPGPFFREVIHSILGSEVEIVDLDSVLTEPIEEVDLEHLATEITKELETGKKSQYRDQDQKIQLAETDARLFLTCRQMAESVQDDDEVLGGTVYLVTGSNLYGIAASRAGMKDTVTIKPSGLAALFDVLALSPISDLELVALFGDPLLAYVVEDSWDDIEALLDQGIGLKGKNLARLRWDLDHGMQEILRQDNSLDELPAEKTTRIWHVAMSKGFRPIPGIENEAEAIKLAEQRGAQQAYDALEGEIKEFGRRKVRYLKNIVKGIRHPRQKRRH